MELCLKMQKQRRDAGSDNCDREEGEGQSVGRPRQKWRGQVMTSSRDIRPHVTTVYTKERHSRHDIHLRPENDQK
jgi:hypothetical protein